VFHEPYPVAKIDTVMLRSMGKRVEKWIWVGQGYVYAASINAAA